MPDLLEDDYRPTFSAWKASPTPASSGAVLKALQPVIDSAITSNAKGNQSPLLASRARRLVLDALPSYDPSRASLKTHLGNHLKGLHRINVQQNEIISLPEQIQLDQHHVFEAENRLRDWNGRDPTDDELSDETGLSGKRLAYLRKSGGGTAEGSAESFSDDGDDIYQPAVVSSDDDGWNQFVYGSLPPADRLIVEHSIGLNGKPVLSGKKLAFKLGVTPAAISQRKARIQALYNQRRSLGVL